MHYYLGKIHILTLYNIKVLQHFKDLRNVGSELRSTILVFVVGDALYR
jgi:hypothetical protein